MSKKEAKEIKGCSLSQVNEYIDKLDSSSNKLVFPNSDLEIRLNTNIDYLVIAEYVNKIVAAVTTDDDGLLKTEFEYCYIDLLLAEVVMRLFTNIELPTKLNGDTDYQESYKIFCKLNLKQKIWESSAYAKETLDFLYSNVWRQLDFMKNRTLNDEYYRAISSFNDVVSELSEIADIQKEITPAQVNAFTEELKKFTASLQESREKTKEAVDVALNDISIKK